MEIAKNLIITEAALTNKQGSVRKYAELRHDFNEGLPGLLHVSVQKWKK